MKRIVSMTLALILLLACFPTTAFAADVITGSCGANVKWTYTKSTGEMVISGSGDMTREPFKAYAELKRDVQSVVIEEGVTSIYDKAFHKFVTLTKISFPDTVTRIGANAFYDCGMLKQIHIPDAVTYIGDYAFAMCNVAEGLRIPEGVTYLGEYAFYGCNKLTSVKIPAGIDGIAEGTFSFCTKLADVTIPKGITYIGQEAFTECWKLTEVKIPEGVTLIDNRAFAYCSNLVSVSLPQSLKTVSRHAFYQCDKLEDVYYAGVKSMREEMRIGSENEPLLDAAWHCRTVKAPVVKISGNTTTGKPKISWEKVKGADKYRIYRATSKTGSYSLLDTVTGTSFTDTTASVGRNYYYKVRTVEAGEASKYSNVVNRVCDLPKPDVTLKVDTASGKPKVTFAKISGAEKYYIVRATSKNGTYQKVATITGTTYIDKTAKAGTNYYYKVKALHAKDAADSAYSEAVNRVCDLARPEVTIQCNSSGNPWLKWKEVTGANGYEIYRATSKNGMYSLIKTTTGTSFADRTATSGKTYYYIVVALHQKAAATSADSVIRSVTAK